MTPHPTIDALREAIKAYAFAVPKHGSLLRDGKAVENAMRAALTAAAEAMRDAFAEKFPASHLFILHPEAIVARLLGEEPAPFTHDEIRAFLEGNAAGDDKSLDDYLEEK